MHIVAKPIEIIVWFRDEDHPRPVRFRLQDRDGAWTPVRVDRIIEVLSQKKAGTDSLIYRCQSEIRGKQTRYELQYLIRESRWVLYKI